MREDAIVGVVERKVGRSERAEVEQDVICIERLFPILDSGRLSKYRQLVSIALPWVARYTGRWC